MSDEQAAPIVTPSEPKWGRAMASQYVAENRSHLGIVAEVCRDIGVAGRLDQPEPRRRQQVSVGTATGALVLTGGCQDVVHRPHRCNPSRNDGGTSGASVKE
jgi:hypothetical protein